MAGLIAGPFATYLSDHRDACNQMVIAARRANQRFDASAFGSALTSVVAPAVDAIVASGGTAGADAAAVDRLCAVLYDVSLPLVAAGAFNGCIAEAWSSLLPGLRPLVLADPRRVVTMVSNAVDTLTRTPGARPREWCARMAMAAAHLGSVGELESTGQVAAWRAGMAAYRTGALVLAERLTAPQLAAALDAASADLERMRADLWWTPGSTERVPNVPEIASAAGHAPIVGVGAFVGVDGPFRRPPVVALDDDGRLVASDGEERWFVAADAFGSAIVRASGSPKLARPAKRSRPASVHHRIPELTSWVHTPGAWAVTTSLSHAVLFVRETP